VNGAYVVRFGGGQQTAFILGGFFFNGDESAGIRLVDSSHHGFQASNFSNDMVSESQFLNWNWAALATAPSLVIINLGLNDYQSGVLPATTKSRIQTFITQAKAIHTFKSWAFHPSWLLRRIDEQT
jgi:hypothetical protein